MPGAGEVIQLCHHLNNQMSVDVERSSECSNVYRRYEVGSTKYKGTKYKNGITPSPLGEGRGEVNFLN